MQERKIGMLRFFSFSHRYFVVKWQINLYFCENVWKAWGGGGFDWTQIEQL